MEYLCEDKRNFCVKKKGNAYVTNKGNISVSKERECLCEAKPNICRDKKNILKVMDTFICGGTGKTSHFSQRRKIKDQCVLKSERKSVHMGTNTTYRTH